MGIPTTQITKNMDLNMRIIILASFVVVVILAGSFDVSAQRTKRTRRAVTPSTNAVDLKKGAEDVAIQIKNISKFVFVLGGVAKGIEDIDKDVKAGRASTEIAKQNEEFKSNVRASVQGIRAGLIKLEVDFRTKPALKPYLTKIQGIANQSARAEDFAFAGRFNDSGKELLVAVEMLADALVVMP